MRIFWEKTVKFVSVSGDPPSNPRLPPVAVGSVPRSLALLFPATITSLSSSFLMVIAFYSAQKKPSNYSKYSAFAFPNFFTYCLIQTL